MNKFCVDSGNYVFTGDLFLGGVLLENKNHEKCINSDVFKKAACKISNLEQASSDLIVKIDKSTVYAPLDSLYFLKQHNISYVSLANNHIQDKGSEGFNEGISRLSSIGINFFGAGENIEEARSKVNLNDKLSLLAYCQFNKPYLKRVQLASGDEYGVNPLLYTNISKDLSLLDNDEYAILCIHWGKENVWFPPKDNIKLAKKILEHPKVKCIIGTHAHRLQGKIEHNGKFCFFCLGNFLFPDFYMMPRTQMVYPLNELTKVITTKEYHPVMSITRKIWKYCNRVSMMVVLDNKGFHEVIVKQNKSKPIVTEVYGFEKYIIIIRYKILSMIYSLPLPVYSIVERLCNFFSTLNKYKNIAIFFMIKNKSFFSVFKLIKQK